MFTRKHQLTIEETKFIISNWGKMTGEEISKILNLPSKNYVNTVVAEIRKAGYPLPRKSYVNSGQSVKSIVTEALKTIPAPSVNA
jgi:hypothetical protein